MKFIKLSLAAVAAFGLFSFTTACDENTMNQMENNRMNNMMNEHNMENQSQQKDVPARIAYYMEIKNALVADDFQATRDAAKIMVENDKEFTTMANAIANSADLMEQRKNFKKLSAAIYKDVNDNEINTTLYWNRCPMAMGGEGANWLSMQEKIQNPYMGQKMPGCGSVKETLKK
ncbi:MULTISPECIES: DUF3347 domain-containing protein [Christiangramia]|uniref:Putative Co/Zn/Cd efflux system membrane fusion protein n=1 Tax=Christiangramia flava JLT2011 TaxID=1229726 RepID=A0A1L7I983_9FLAO|nr:DUF3347 domain-containing protein [Christiangramia flava]APU70171.1 putative Co/Zn/Cd efflux system membrane fusion protein [Christiangramia flava JLT2011]OSS39658.1 Co/Zn/Cd efflux system membrane fusion protein [Christiangramia flava JLT2011]